MLKYRVGTGSLTGSTSLINDFVRLNMISEGQNLKQNIENIKIGSNPLKPDVHLDFTILSFRTCF